MENFDFIKEAQGIEEIINKDVEDFEKRGKEISSNNGAYTAFKNKDIKKLLATLDYRFLNHMNSVKFDSIASSEEISATANALHAAVNETKKQLEDLEDVRSNLTGNVFTYDDQKNTSERLNSLFTEVINITQEKIDKAEDLLNNKNAEKYEEKEEVKVEKTPVIEEDKEEVKEDIEKVEKVEETDKDYKIEDFEATFDELNKSVDSIIDNEKPLIVQDAVDEEFNPVNVETHSIEDEEVLEEQPKEETTEEVKEEASEENQEGVFDTDSYFAQIQDAEAQVDEKIEDVQNNIKDLREAADELEASYGSEQTLHVVDDEEEFNVEGAKNDYAKIPADFVKVIAQEPLGASLQNQDEVSEEENISLLPEEEKTLVRAA